MRVITCFSYKGGAGRTVTACNIAAALASRESVGVIEEPLDFKVAVFDLDVFSAGTHRVFDISNESIQKHTPSIQDYLMSSETISPGEYATKGGITPAHDLMRVFVGARGAKDACRDDLTLFAAAPGDKRFIPAKYHENVLLELILELENRGYGYVILDGEAGTRAMADIAIRLSDVVLMMFRLTWQHIEGSLVQAKSLLKQEPTRSLFLLPTCVPLADPKHGIYQQGAPGRDYLEEMTEKIPEVSEFDKWAEDNRTVDGRPGAGWFWANHRHCIHESLYLKGGERVIVFDNRTKDDLCAKDFYFVARELSKLPGPVAG